MSLVMGIPNVKRIRITRPDGGRTATLMAVVPKGTDIAAYAAEAAKRFDWKAYEESLKQHFKVRVGQQKQKKR